MLVGSGDHTYELVEEWATLPEGESFVDVGRVCVDENDDVLVLSRSEHPVMVFDGAGERKETWGEGVFSDRPHGMGLGPDGTVYCTDDGNHTVREFSRDGELRSTLGTEGRPSETGYLGGPDLFENLASIARGGEPFNRPTGVTVSASGDVFVSDGYGNARVHVFDEDGTHLYSWGGPGAGEGEFRLPHSIHLDDEGRVWVTDRENSRIQVFDPDGGFVEEWIDLIRPTDLHIADDGTVFVSELCKRVSVFGPDGELLARWGNEAAPEDDPLFVAPHTIAADSNGDLYVGEVAVTYGGVDRGEQTIRKFARVA